MTFFGRTDPTWHGSCSLPAMSGNPLMTQTPNLLDNFI
jgi:hypothetical protein